MANQIQNGSMKELGKFIQDRRIARGMRSESLASAIDRSQSWISRVETGAMKTLPEPEDISAIAKALDVTVSDLLEAAGYLTASDRETIRANPFESFDLRWHVVEGMRTLDVEDDEVEYMLHMFLRELRREETQRIRQ